MIKDMLIHGLLLSIIDNKHYTTLIYYPLSNKSQLIHPFFYCNPVKTPLGNTSGVSCFTDCAKYKWPIHKGRAIRYLAVFSFKKKDLRSRQRIHTKVACCCTFYSSLLAISTATATRWSSSTFFSRRSTASST